MLLVLNKKRLNERVLLSTYNMFKLMDKKLITNFKLKNFCLTGPMTMNICNSTQIINLNKHLMTLM